MRFRSNLILQIGAGLAFCFATFFIPSRALAAEIEAVAIDDDTTIIFVIGEIQSGDAATFRRIAASYESPFVALESPGGSTIEAIEIGKAIHLLGLPTLVINNSQCNSACALIWLAGSPRTITRTARVGFHASYTDQNGVRLESGVGNALVGRYLTQLNLPISAVIFSTRASPDTLTWLDASNFTESGIETLVVDDFDLSADEDGGDASGKLAKPMPPPITTVPTATTPVETVIYGEAGEWLIVLDKTLADSCFALKYFNDGTIMRLSNDVRYSITDGSGFILITNPSWASLATGRKIEIDFRFDTFEPWEAVASVTALGGYNWLNISFSGESGITLKREFGSARNMRLSREGRLVSDLDLAGSGQAMRVLSQCQVKANADRVSRDPFAK
jgi:hypothetical protein